ncbi:GNAT family N-acetyltransferase [Burkholderia ambifaria]|uniref:GNAT family N-acetyltransferase n=1 Tax=Burkholderia ambifaria TaxID=152480 RepID=UPI001B90C768|nr:GNAT family N-acetyltransferase [Burkholderia ambifaria]MBR8174876.1 GNAT family N-acetyltransferase [Burkholderia ambifaria]
MDLALRRIGELTRAQLEGFACGSDSLNAFLLESAHDYAAHGLTQTAVAFMDEDPAPVGFFSLSADVIRLSVSEGGDLGLPFDCPIRYFPAVKITKLAVRSDKQGAGIGNELVNMISGLAFQGNVAVRLLTVDSVNDPATIRFYERCGFRSSLEDEIRQERARQVRRPRKQGQEQAGEDDIRTVLLYRDLYDPLDDEAPAVIWAKAAQNQLIQNDPVEQPRA